MNYRERGGDQKRRVGAGFTPTKRGVSGTFFSHPERGGGHNTFGVSFNMGARSFNHTGAGKPKVSTL